MYHSQQSMVYGSIQLYMTLAAFYVNKEYYKNSILQTNVLSVLTYPVSCSQVDPAV